MKDFLFFAITHPAIVLNTLLKKPLTEQQREKITFALINKIESKCNIGNNVLKKYHDELKNNHELISYINTSLKNLPNTGAFNPTFQTVIYALIRHLMPENIVETGVANGVSSTIILTALDLNNKGKLHSVDLPTTYWENTPYREEDKVQVKNNDVGWIIPQNLRGRWKLNLGKSKEKLPDIFNQIKKCEIFFHDSEHSYDNMTFEFNIAWPSITKRGIIIADDVHRNKAFDDFVNRYKTEIISLKIGQFGLIMKK